MHCLYCDRPLALLKRLTGDSEFCSKEHRKIYQTEHNQLALARLLESQRIAKTKPRPNKAASVRPARVQAAPVSVALAPLNPQSRSEPEYAGFICEFLREASAVSEPHRLREDLRF